MAGRAKTGQAKTTAVTRETKARATTAARDTLRRDQSGRRDIQAKFDALDRNNARLRRIDPIEMFPENGTTGAIYSTSDRLTAITNCRNLERNFSPVKCMIRQLRNNIVGIKGGRMRLNIDDKELAIKAEAAWASWARRCDRRQGRHLNDILSLVVAAKFREGDILVVYDNFLGSDGSLYLFEADQIAPVNAEEFIRFTAGRPEFAGAKQVDGLVVNAMGAVLGYFATSGAGGAQTLPNDSYMYIPAESGFLIRSDYRYGQYRGTPDLLTILADMNDMYSMRAKEIQTAKWASTFGGTVEAKAERAAALGIEAEGGDVEDTIYTDAEPTAPVKKENYDALDELTGGYLEYLDPGDKFNPIDLNRPSVNFREFFSEVVTSAGSAMGIGKSYVTMTPAGSYTAFRGDTLMTWKTYAVEQKKIERNLLDKLAVLVLDDAGLGLPEGWEHKVSWLWDQMPQIDPRMETETMLTSIKGGLSNFAEHLGPDWRAIFDQLAVEIKYAKERNLDTLSLFETVAGASVEPTDPAKPTVAATEKTEAMNAAGA